jgi:hypothetical protein
MMDKRWRDNNRSRRPSRQDIKFEVPMISQLLRASVLALVCTTSAATSAPARSPYDGAWSVLIVTQQGSCDRAYRYGVQIIDGNVRYDGSVVNFDGRVDKKGTVRVTVSAGSSRANGTGKLSRNAGRGVWRGNSGSDACAGYWEAERR